MIELDPHFTTCGVCQNEYEIDGEDNQESGGENANGSSNRSKKLRNSNKKSRSSTSSSEHHDDNHNNRDVCQRLPLQSFLCGHVLCKACVANMYAAQVETNAKKVWLSCPFCNKEKAFHPRERIIHTVTVQLIEWQRDMMNRQQSLTTTSSSAVSRPVEDKEQQHGHPSKTSPRSVASSSATTTDASSLHFEESTGQSKKRAAATVGRSDTRGKYQRREAISSDMGVEQTDNISRSTSTDVSMTNALSEDLADPTNGHPATLASSTSVASRSGMMVSGVPTVHQQNNIVPMSSSASTVEEVEVEDENYIKHKNWHTSAIMKGIRNYGDRFLIARHISGKGIMRLGGNAITIYPTPAADHRNLSEILSILKGARVMCYSDQFQSQFAPQFAGQTYAAVDWFPNDGREMAIFMRRSIKREGGKTTLVLGWEYCGNYIGAGNNEVDDIPYSESHKLVSNSRKEYISDKYIASTKEYGSDSFVDWHERLSASPIENLPLNKQNMIKRAKNLGYHSQMSKGELFQKVLVNLDEFYELAPIKFVRYDEDIYNYVQNGRTNKDKYGNIITKRRGQQRHLPALASDWYAILDQHSSHS